MSESDSSYSSYGSGDVPCKAKYPHPAWTWVNFGLILFLLILLIVFGLFYNNDRNTVRNQGLAKEIFNLPDSQQSFAPNGGDFISTSRSDLKIDVSPDGNMKGRSFSLINTGNDTLTVLGGSGGVTITGNNEIQPGRARTFAYDSNTSIISIDY